VVSPTGHSTDTQERPLPPTEWSCSTPGDERRRNGADFGGGFGGPVQDTQTQCGVVTIMNHCNTSPATSSSVY